jgi:DNA repair protein RecO (recombination protein O)
MPNLNACNICGSKDAITTLSADMGGYVCKNCITNEPLVSEKTLKLIRMYYYVDISKITKLEVSEQATKEINTFLDMYYDKYTGLYLKTKSFLKSLNKINRK